MFGTCFGPLSRNRAFGFRLGQGETMEEIRASTTEVAEGVATSMALVKMIKEKCKGYRLDLKYPILFGVANILEGKQTPREGLEGLMNMPLRMESLEEMFDGTEILESEIRSQLSAEKNKEHELSAPFLFDGHLLFF